MITKVVHFRETKESGPLCGLGKSLTVKRERVNCPECLRKLAIKEEWENRLAPTSERIHMVKANEKGMVCGKRKATFTLPHQEYLPEGIHPSILCEKCFGGLVAIPVVVDQEAKSESAPDPTPEPTPEPEAKPAKKSKKAKAAKATEGTEIAKLTFYECVECGKKTSAKPVTAERYATRKCPGCYQGS